jgi:UDP-N-acetylglucosamine 2-epimerase (non-hydrolysing)
MLDEALEVFQIQPDIDLNIMRKSQSLFDITANSLRAIEDVIRKESPNLVIVQGDTTTTFVGSLASFYLEIPVGHIEAGLRTDNMYQPFPEEINRRLTSQIATIHFTPTKRASDNLLREGIPRRNIIKTGNTSIDALLMTRERIITSNRKQNNFAKQFPFMHGRQHLILVTAHRRESFGEGLQNICAALRETATRYPEVAIVYPVHLNPNVKGPVIKMLGNISNIYLTEPQGYESFVYLMMNASLILTDSGGIQEEAPSLGKPVLVLRTVTERPEALEAGTARLVGTNKSRIVKDVSKFLEDPLACTMGCVKKNPFGDGKATARIIEGIAKRFIIRHLHK